MNLYAFFPLVTFIVSLAMGVYVLMQDPKDRMRRAFFMLTFWIFLATLGDFGRLISDNEGEALDFFHLKWLGLAFIQPAVLDLVLMASVWVKRWDTKIVEVAIFAPALALIALDSMGYVFNGVESRPWGFEPVYGTGFMVWIVMWFVYIAISMALLLLDLRTRDPVQKDLCKILLAGLLIPTILESMAGGMSSSNMVPELVVGNLAMLGFLVFFRWAIYRKRIFALTPKKEVLENGTEAPELKLPPHHIYRIEGEPQAYTYGLFRDLVVSGLFGLIISRRPPNKIKEETGLIETPMVWISSTSKEGTRTVSPSEMGQIVALVKEFINKAEGTLVLIDGVEFLIFQNGPKMVLNALFLLSEIASLHNTRIIIPLDPAAIDKATMALLERETVDLKDA